MTLIVVFLVVASVLAVLTLAPPKQAVLTARVLVAVLTLTLVLALCVGGIGTGTSVECPSPEPYFSHQTENDG